MQSNEKDDEGVGRCEITGCHRQAVMTYHFVTENEGDEYYNLCLPCRRAIELARRVPWNDESDKWHEAEALNEFRKVKE